MHTLEELHAHYKAVRARLNNPPKKEPAVRSIYPTPVSGPYTDPLDLPAPVIKISCVAHHVVNESAVKPETPAQKILSEVALKHEMPPTTFRSQSRRMDYVLCRQEAAFRLNTELGFSLSQIGRLFGHRDHTTVLNAINRYKKNLALGGKPWARKSGVSNACVTKVEPQTQNDHE